MSDSTDQPHSHSLSMCVVRRRRLSLPDVTPLVPSTETSLTDGGCHTAAPRGVSMPYLSPPTFQAPSSVIIGPVPSHPRKPPGRYHHSPQSHSLYPFQVSVRPHSRGPVPYDAYPSSPPSPSDRFIRRPREAASVPPPSLHTPNAVVEYHSQRAAEMRAIVEGRKRHMERQYRLRVRGQMEEEAQARGRGGARRRMVPVLPVVRHFMETMLVPDSPKSTSSNPPDSDRETRRRIKMMPPQLEYLGKLWGKTRFPSAAERQITGRHIGLSSRQVQVWFQNRRQKEKRLADETRADPAARSPTLIHTADAAHHTLTGSRASGTASRASVDRPSSSAYRPLSPSPSPELECDVQQSPLLTATPFMPRRHPHPSSETGSRSSSLGRSSPYPRTRPNLRVQAVPLPRELHRPSVRFPSTPIQPAQGVSQRKWWNRA